MNPNFFLGTLPCGCGVAICVDDPRHPTLVDDMRAIGLQCSHPMTNDKAKAVLLETQCDNYPHDEWDGDSA